MTNCNKMLKRVGNFAVWQLELQVNKLGHFMLAIKHVTIFMTSYQVSFAQNTLANFCCQTADPTV